jgi:hypothetical protein
MRDKKGFALLMAIVASVIVAAGIAAALYFLLARIQGMRYYDERLKGYYLCEAGASRALYLVKNGSVEPPNQGTFDFRIADKTYAVSYEITGIKTAPLIISRIKLDSGLTYYLKIGGLQEQWPFFLKGMIPPLAD